MLYNRIVGFRCFPHKKKGCPSAPLFFVYYPIPDYENIKRLKSCCLGVKEKPLGVAKEKPLCLAVFPMVEMMNIRRVQDMGDFKHTFIVIVSNPYNNIRFRNTCTRCLNAWWLWVLRLSRINQRIIAFH